ncbi:MAG: acyltransferase [Oscillospiraceae bacterium]|nr:acyltransferase [Oscillospiraceae bacterium]
MNQQNIATKSARNSALELLRIIAMLLIVLSHICAHSGFVIDGGSVSLNRLLVQWGALGGLGNNLFVLISGYFLCTRGTKAPSLGKLFVQVWFYSISLFVVCKFAFDYDYSLIALAEVFLPTIFQEYWFFTAYVLLALLSPFLNLFLESVSKTGLRKLLLLAGVLWVLIPTFTRMQMGGNKLTHFMFLYLIGAYFRKYPENLFSRKGLRRLVTLASFALLFLSTLAFEVLGTKWSIFDSHGKFFFESNTLLVMGASLGLFSMAIYGKAFFNPLINGIAGCTFGVYLIHDNPAVRKLLWRQLLPHGAYMDSPFLIVGMLFSVTAVFLLCTGIEYLRQKTLAKPMLFLYEKVTGLLLRWGSGIWGFARRKFGL